MDDDQIASYEWAGMPLSDNESRIVRLVGHTQYQVLARTGRFRVVLHLRAAAWGIGVENHQRMPPSFHLTYYFDQYI